MFGSWGGFPQAPGASSGRQAPATVSVDPASPSRPPTEAPPQGYPHAYPPPPSLKATFPAEFDIMPQVHAAREPQEPSAPPLPPEEEELLAPGKLMVQTPKVEAQPWVKDLWRFLATSTTGTARVDLKRPVLSPADSYGRNLLFVDSPAPAPGATGTGRPRDGGGAIRRGRVEPLRGYGRQDNRTIEEEPPPPGRARGATVVPGGARLKVTRHARLLQPSQAGAFGAAPWLDFGLGCSLDMDGQRLNGVARLKIKEVVSIKLLPSPLVKVSKTLRLPGLNLSLKFLFECPLSNLGEFYRPPSRLMLRVDNNIGSGLHLTPSSIEFDERVIMLGNNLSIRAAAGLTFPRQLPISEDDKDAFAFKVHRLSLKTAW